MKPLLTVIALIALATTAEAQHCRIRQAFVRHHHVQQFVAPVYQAYWSVGSALREEAIAERAAQIAVEKFAAQLQQQGGPQGLQAGGFDLDTHFPELLSTSCVQCHNANKASGGIRFDQDSIDELTAYRSFRSISDGTMPQGKPLSDDLRQQYGAAAQDYRQQLLEALK